MNHNLFKISDLNNYNHKLEVGIKEIFKKYLDVMCNYNKLYNEKIKGNNFIIYIIYSKYYYFILII